jgi:deazaflavin-dependent oxidoreductase (nitroreductase family)
VIEELYTSSQVIVRGEAAALLASPPTTQTKGNPERTMRPSAERGSAMQAKMQANRQRNPFTWVFGALVRLVVALTALVTALYLLLLGWGALLRIPWVNEQTRHLTKSANGPLRRIAGTRWGAWYFSLSALTHLGRSSGHEYVTPLSAYPFGDGFVLALAYPPEQTDWYQNVLAAGTCTLKYKGHEYALERPEPISISQAISAYPLLVRPFIWVNSTNQAVWLHRRAEVPTSAPAKDQSPVAAH